jgi:signal transduction histidine kinase
MAGAVAHHFNNLLGAALGSLELAEGDVPPGSRAQARIGRAREATRRAADLSLQMLTYLGRDAEVARQPLEPARALAPLLEELRTRLPQEVALTGELPEDLPPLEMDPDHLATLVTHLVLNAAEALGEAPGRILVRAGRMPTGAHLPGHRLPVDWSAPEGGATILEVSDDGPGISPDLIEHLFEPFFTTRFQGRGLGLASVLGIARTYGGAVSVESAPGQGATFRVFLP